MAGSTQIVNPNGAFGLPSSARGFSLGAEMTSTETSTTIAVGDCVMFDTGSTVGVGVKQATTSSANVIVGVAQEAIAPGATGIVTVFGYAKVNCDAGITAGTVLVSPGTTAGRATAAGSTAVGGFGVALTGASSNKLDAWVTGSAYPTT